MQLTARFGHRPNVWFPVGAPESGPAENHPSKTLRSPEGNDRSGPENEPAIAGVARAEMTLRHVE